MIPVYVFYSMFGWQRTGDQMWALGDQLGRGFLLGATAGRTTLAGEGLQHNDGHSVLLASVSEACVSYDCAWAFELAYVVRDALRRMYEATGEHPDGENIFYYLTVYNEPYPQPAEPADFPGGTAALEDGILRGLPSYLHPRLMPDYWEFPMSMGLGALNSIYQGKVQPVPAGAADPRHVAIARVGIPRRRRDGRARGARRDRAGRREELDNLTFVINCNLQRNDGHSLLLASVTRCACPTTARGAEPPREYRSP